MSKKFYIYIWLDPRKPGNFFYGNDLLFDYEPIYVGKGSNKRYKPYPSKRKYNSFLIKVCNKIKNETNNTPIVLLYRKNLNEDDAYKLEEIIIDKIGRRNLELGPLLNLTRGGLGGKSIVFSPERIKKLIIRLQENHPFKGKHHSIETIELFSKTRVGELNPRAKIYIINNGTNIIKIKSLKTWCKNNNLNYSTIRSAMLTKRWIKGYYITEM